MRTTRLRDVSNPRSAGRPSRLTVMALALGVAGACGPDGAPAAPHAGGPPDEVQAPIVFDETQIAAHVQGGELHVALPVGLEDAASATGLATATLLTLDGDELAQASATFSVTQGEGTAEVVLPADALPSAGADEVRYLVGWRLAIAGSTATGTRSLLYVLPKVDVRAWLPERLLVGAASKVRVLAVHPGSGQPVEGVVVRLALASAQGDGDGSPVQTYEATTDDSGSAVFDVPAQQADDAGEWVATVSASDAPQSAGDSPWLAAAVQSDLAIERSHRVLLTPDKPVYQPGQIVHLRALALRQPTLEPEGDADVTFEIRDGKGNLVFREQAATDGFGVAATTFKLASQVNEGAFEIKAVVGGVESIRSVEVAPYSLPKFGLSTSLGEAWYLPGDVVTGVVDAEYFFGQPVSRAQVSVAGTTLDVDVVTFATVDGETDANGLFPFELTLPSSFVGQPLAAGQPLVALAVTVADAAGQVETKTLPVVVAGAPLVVAAIPESGELVPGVANGVYLFAADPLGRAVDATLTATLGGVELAATTLATGIARVELTPPADAPVDGSATVTLDVTASMAAGDTVTTTATLAAGQASGGLLARLDQHLYTVGETLTLTLFATTLTGRAFVDVVKAGQTLVTQAVDLAEGTATVALDLDAALIGDIVVEAYAVDPQGVILRDTAVAFVQDATELHIDIQPSADVYGPGDEGALTFTVTGADGTPTVAALGVQIVDEAVYHVAEAKPGLLEAAFLLQDALREPTWQVDGVHFDVLDVATADPDSASAQDIAGAAFAALDAAALTGEVSSWGALVAELPNALADHRSAELAAVEAALRAGIDSGAIPTDSIADGLAAAPTFYDAWGSAYRYSGVRDGWDGVYVTLESDGPDERANTEDDWSGELLVIDWQDRWEDDFNAEGAAGGGAGGGPLPGYAPTADAGAPALPSGPGGGEAGPTLTVRKDFPETLAFLPSVITGADGVATVPVGLADSITTWRVSALGHTAEGALGSATGGMLVFQDFFVDVSFPPTLTRGDEVTFPVAVYNYMDAPQSVTVEVQAADWFELLGPASVTLELEAGQVAGTSFPVRVNDVGWHPLTVLGVGTTLSDGVQRLVHVVPDGVEVRESASGVLEGAVTHDIGFPSGPDAVVPGSEDLRLTVFPGVMAQAVAGLDSLLQMPSGCFEQTTATNWPNALVLDYLQQTGQVSPDIELKALDFLAQGWQRLLTFECTGGGFVWFGDPSPANVILSAMGVMEFSDMAEVMAIDDAVISRTADWVVADQEADGHWHADQGSEFATVQYDDVKTTAWVAWALASSPYGGDAVSKALDFLAPRATAPDTDVYALAMMANAFAQAEPGSSRTSALLTRLADLAVLSEDGKTAHWVYEGSSYTYGGPQTSGVNGTSIEVTALAIQAFVTATAHLPLVGPAVAFLAGNKDSFGNWGSTHATILSLRAMLSTLSHQAEEGEGTATVALDGEVVGTVTVTDVNRNVFQTLELTNELALDGEPQTLEIAWDGTGQLMYEAVWAHHVPGDPQPPSGEAPLAIEVAWDTTELAVSDLVTCTATVTNATAATLSMVMVDLGVPPGFRVLTGALDSAVAEQHLMKYELPGQAVTLYLESLAPGEAWTVAFELQATLPVKAAVPPSSAYLYYDTEQRADAAGFEVTVGE